MFRRAVEQRWPVGPEQRQRVVDRLMDILANNPNDKDAIQASRALIAIDASNQSDEHHNDHRLDEGRNRVLALLERARSKSDSGAIECGRIRVIDASDGNAFSEDRERGDI